MSQPGSEDAVEGKLPGQLHGVLITIQAAGAAVVVRNGVTPVAGIDQGYSIVSVAVANIGQVPVAGIELHLP
ncbi:hypothetical protein D3C77_317080 [compost metagenome]